jgi:hypothetical protein
VAAHSEKASRREFITAVVAIVVGGLVGLTGAVVGCQSSRDSQRTARDAQREATRAQREQADLAELRSVLDNAAADLDNFMYATFTYVNDPEAKDNESGVYQPSTAAERRRIAAGRRSRASLVRLELRLGEKSPVVKFYSDASDRFVEAAEFVAVGPGSGENGWRQDADADMEAGQRRQARFVAAARELVGSHLPG